MSALPPAFFAPESHAEALVALAAERIQARDGDEAFRFADRHCRILNPGARDLLARAEALRLKGHESDARGDLDRAARLDPWNEQVNFAALSWGSPAMRASAARRIIEAPGGAQDSLAAAIAHSLRSGVPLVRRLTIVERRMLCGWVVWQGHAPLELTIECGARATRVSLTADPSHRFAKLAAAADVVIECGFDVRSVEIRQSGERIDIFVPCTRDAPQSLPTTLSAGAEEGLQVIVPVYGDFDATKACLETLLRQRGAFPIEIVVVDDCAPDPRFRTYLSAKAKSSGFTLIRNELNLGFVGAVNAALQRYFGGDVLLLNADTLLPPGALDRLRTAARSRPRVGTVTPLSNNGEFTSFPKPFQENPLPSAADVVALDRVCAAVNAGLVIPIPSGIGFCLYVTRACLLAVGPLSPRYSPGYGEDVEFCLAAREKGFLNLCAADLFVGHAGSRSFRAEKRAYVVRNLKILEERFPTYRAESAAFLESDPLRAARAAIEEAFPSRAKVRLIVQGARAAEQAVLDRLGELERSHPRPKAIVLRPSVDGTRTEVRAADGCGPESLSFDLAEARGRAGLLRFLKALRVDRVEIVDGASAAAPVIEAAMAIRAPLDLVLSERPEGAFPQCSAAEYCADEAEEDLCRSCLKATNSLAGERRRQFDRLLKKADQIIVNDAIAEAYARRLESAPPIRKPVRRSAPKPAQTETGRALAVLVPAPSPAVDRLLSALARRCVRGDGEIVVFGACIGDLALMSIGRLFVVGPLAVTDAERLVANYEVGFLLSPYREGRRFLLDASPAFERLPKAYFDWSLGMARVATGDLALDPRLCDLKAARAIAAWRERSAAEDVSA